MQAIKLILQVEEVALKPFRFFPIPLMTQSKTKTSLVPGIHSSLFPLLFAASRTFHTKLWYSNYSCSQLSHDVFFDEGLESGTAESGCFSKYKSSNPFPFNLGSNRRLSVTPRAFKTEILASSKRRVTFFIAFSSERCLMRAVSVKVSVKGNK